MSPARRLGRVEQFLRNQALALAVCALTAMINIAIRSYAKLPGGCIDTRLVLAFPAGPVAGWPAITTPVGKSGSVCGPVRCCARMATKGPLPTVRPPARGAGFDPLQLQRLLKSAPESRHPAAFDIAVSMSANEVVHFQSCRRDLAISCRLRMIAPTPSNWKSIHVVA